MAVTTKKRRFNFTKAGIEQLADTGTRTDYHDEKVAHLIIRVAQRKVFYWYGRASGRPVRIKLGVFPDLSLENARKAAQRVSGRVAQGLPPVDKPNQDSADITLGALFGVYLELHAKPRKKSWTQDQYTFDRHLAEWKHRRLSSISKADLQRLHSQIGTGIGKTTANRVRALLSTMWNVARDTGHWQGDNPVAAVRKFPEQDRERYLRADELPGFFQQLDADDNQDFADYTRLSLFTGARQRNVLSMRWENINLDRAEWSIPGQQFKTGKAQTIPLTDEALQVLRKRQQHSETSEYVFPGRGVTGHLTRPGKWWDRLLARCGLSDHLTMHDLRRTLGSWQAAGGASLLVIGKTLGHKDQRSTQVYSRMDTDPVRKSMTSATKAITDAAQPPAATTTRDMRRHIRRFAERALEYPTTKDLAATVLQLLDDPDLVTWNFPFGYPPDGHTPELALGHAFGQLEMAYWYFHHETKRRKPNADLKKAKEISQMVDQERQQDRSLGITAARRRVARKLRRPDQSAAAAFQKVQRADTKWRRHMQQADDNAIHYGVFLPAKRIPEKPSITT